LIGADILSGSTWPVLQMAEEIALSHHERWDGTGYPDGLVEEAIPMSGRIVIVADNFDALTHSRPYAEAWDADKAAAEIRRQSGQHFDPQVVEAFGELDLGSLLSPMV
jgi:putative two-component system response regulator